MKNRVIRPKVVFFKNWFQSLSLGKGTRFLNKKTALTNAKQLCKNQMMKVCLEEAVLLMSTSMSFSVQ